MAKKGTKKEKAVESNNKEDVLEIARKAIIKKYGDIIGSLGDEKELFLPTISSGSLKLDAALGRGGFAKGRVYEFYGQPSSGKTTLAMSVMAQAQKRKMKCCFVDVEKVVDPKLFAAMGVNNNEVDLIKGHAGEENLDALELLMKTGALDVAVIDSVSALIPKAESEANIDDEFMGLLARLMSKTMRRFVPIASQTNTLIIFINQLRYKIGSWGNPETTTGGEALSFYATGRISVSGGDTKKTRIHDENGIVIGHNTKFEIVKNKLAPPYRTAEIPLIYGVGYDLYKELLDLGVRLAVINKAGNFYKYNDQNMGNGEMQTKTFLKENPDIYNEIKEAVIDTLDLKELYERNS